MSAVQRFMAKVAIGSDGTCWRWIGAISGGKYGMFGMPGGNIRAHRAAFMLFRGPIPEGMSVCHHCDNPWCVNPDHLFTGTQKDNVADCISKGRNSAPPVSDWRGRTKPHHWQRLTPAQALEILTRVRAGELQERIAADYGISSRTVSKIKLGQRWPQLSGQ